MAISLFRTRSSLHACSLWPIYESELWTTAIVVSLTVRSWKWNSCVVVFMNYVLCGDRKWKINFIGGNRLQWAALHYSISCATSYVPTRYSWVICLNESNHFSKLWLWRKICRNVKLIFTRADVATDGSENLVSSALGRLAITVSLSASPCAVHRMICEISGKQCTIISSEKATKWMSIVTSTFLACLSFRQCWRHSCQLITCMTDPMS